MILAVLDETVQGALFLIAVILFVIAAFWGYRPAAGPEGRTVGLVPLGLAFFAFVFMYNAFDAA